MRHFRPFAVLAAACVLAAALQGCYHNTHEKLPVWIKDYFYAGKGSYWVFKGRDHTGLDTLFCTGTDDFTDHGLEDDTWDDTWEVLEGRYSLPFDSAQYNPVGFISAARGSLKIGNNYFGYTNSGIVEEHNPKGGISRIPTLTSDTSLYRHVLTATHIYSPNYYRDSLVFDTLYFDSNKGLVRFVVKGEPYELVNFKRMP